MPRRENVNRDERYGHSGKDDASEVEEWGYREGSYQERHVMGQGEDANRGIKG